MLLPLPRFVTSTLSTFLSTPPPSSPSPTPVLPTPRPSWRTFPTSSPPPPISTTPPTPSSPMSPSTPSYLPTPPPSSSTPRTTKRRPSLSAHSAVSKHPTVSMASSVSSMMRVLAHLCIVLTVVATSVSMVLVMTPMLLVVAWMVVVWSPVLIVHMYITAMVVQALYAPKIRWHPLRVMRMYKAVTENILSNLFSPLAQHLLRFSIYRVFCGKRLRPYVARNIMYSETTKSRLDIYLPASAHLASSKRANGEKLSPGHLPVLIFIYGGAWNSGSKEIYEPLGHQLRRSGILTVIPEYRTYPHGTTDTMMQEVADCIHWVHQNISHYGGDPTNIHVCGHSSGAHLTLLTFLASAWTSSSSSTSFFTPQTALRYTPKTHPFVNEAPPLAAVPTTFPQLTHPLPPLQSVMLFSGVYDLVQHYQYECERGIEEISGLRRANGHTYENLLLRSPSLLLSSFLQGDRTHTLDYLPSHFPFHLVLFHGHQDRMVPVTQSTEVFHLLRKCGLESLDIAFHSMDHAQPLALLMQDSNVFHQVVKTVRRVSRNSLGRVD